MRHIAHFQRMLSGTVNAEAEQSIRRPAHLYLFAVHVHVPSLVIGNGGSDQLAVLPGRDTAGHVVIRAIVIDPVAHLLQAGHGIRQHIHVDVVDIGVVHLALGILLPDIQVVGAVLDGELQREIGLGHLAQ